MSIYATQEQFKLPIDGWADEADDADWIEVYVQAVPGHIGHPRDYPEGDPYADFLPPVVDDPDDTRAAFFVDAKTTKEGQRYVNPVLMLTGVEYATIGWSDLMARLQTAIDERWQDEYTCAACGHKYRMWHRRKNVHCACGAVQAWSQDGQSGEAVWLF